MQMFKKDDNKAINVKKLWNILNESYSLLSFNLLSLEGQWSAIEVVILV